MNIYDMKQVHCFKCGRFIGEIDYEAEITMPICGKCANPMPEGDDKIRYNVNRYRQPRLDPIPA